MKASFGSNVDLFDSGVLICTAGVETTIRLDDLEVVFAFRDDPNEPPRADTEAVTGKKLKITFLNWNNALGVSFKKPVVIGKLNNRQLLFNCVIRQVGAADAGVREVVFNAYLGEEALSGAN